MPATYQSKNNKVGLQVHLLGITVSQLFIPFPKLPFIHMAPINIFVLLLTLALIPKLGKLSRIRGSAMLILICLALFSFVDQALNVVEDTDNVGVFGSVRAMIMLLSAATMLDTRRSLDVFLKWALFGVFCSALLGLLVYFFGGVFLEIRNWMLQSTEAKSGIAGEGLWVSGLSGNHFNFGYLMAGASVLPLVMLATQKRKMLWTMLYFFLLGALIFNAERSASVAVMASSLYFAYHAKLFRSKNALILLMVFISVAVATKNYRDWTSIVTDSQSKTGLERLADTNDFVQRMKWQFYGIKSVFLHPAGVTEEQYRQVVLGRNGSSSVWVPYPHNHYINVGMHAGYIGWVLLFIFLLALYTLIRFSRKRAWQRGMDLLFLRGLHAALVAVMFNALFHNNGMFFFEPISLTLLAACIGASNWVAHSRSPADGR